jgi:glutathione S-transferase
MSSVILFGFPRSTFVKVAGLILTARNIDYDFHNTEREMYLPIHLERHPFGRVPVLIRGVFMLYETNAIAAYVDEVFPGSKLRSEDSA